MSMSTHISLTASLLHDCMPPGISSWQLNCNRAEDKVPPVTLLGFHMDAYPLLAQPTCDKLICSGHTTFTIVYGKQ